MKQLTTLNEYQELAWKTARYPQVQIVQCVNLVDDCFKIVGSVGKHIYPALKLVGECEEFYQAVKKQENVIEEAGDVLWYLAAIHTAQGRCMNDLGIKGTLEMTNETIREYLPKGVCYSEAVRQAISMLVEAAGWAEAVGKAFREQRDFLDADAWNRLFILFYSLKLVLFHFDLTLVEVCNYNLKKLEKRYEGR